MREAQFLKQNAEKWKLYEKEVNAEIPTDTAANRFVELTDDLAYARTFYPKSNTEKYLNGLAAVFHQKIYRNKKEKKGTHILVLAIRIAFPVQAVPQAIFICIYFFCFVLFNGSCLSKI
jgi:hypothetical protein